MTEAEATKDATEASSHGRGRPEGQLRTAETRRGCNGGNQGETSTSVTS